MTRDEDAGLGAYYYGVDPLPTDTPAPPELVRKPSYPYPYLQSSSWLNEPVVLYMAAMLLLSTAATIILWCVYQ
jgi:hypothetical protein